MRQRTMLQFPRLSSDGPGPKRRADVGGAAAWRRRDVLAALALAASLPGAAGAQPVAWPTRSISLIVGYPPGGSTDLTGRTVATDLAERLGQPVVVENVGGAGGTLGAQRVAQAAPDGYTLLLGSNNEMAISGLVQSLRYDPLLGFTPIGMVASQPMVLVAGPKAGVDGLDGFIERARRHPGRYSFGSSGVGTALHLAGEMVKQAAGLFVVHIPYRGVGPLSADLLAGNIEYGVFVLSSALPHIRAGRMLPLGLTSAQRSAVAPEIAPLAEHPALRAVDLSSWFGLWGPAGLPAAVRERLQAALAQTLAAPEVRRRLEEAGATMAAPGVDLAARQAREIDKLRAIVDFAKIRA